MGFRGSATGLIALVLLSCGRGRPERYIMFTGSLSGYLEACSCPGTPVGGLNAVSHLAREFRRSHPDALLVDAGCFSPDTADSLNPWFMAKAMSLVGYDAVSLACLDTAYMDWTGDLPILGPEEPTRLVKGVLFVRVGQDVPDISSAPSHDYLVFLSTVGKEGARTLARQYSPDAIIEARERFEGFMEGKTLVVGAAPRGMALGILRLGPGGAEAWFVPVSGETPTEPDVDFVLSEYGRAFRAHLSRVGSKISFRGPGFCRFCHEKEYEAWKSSEHAGAFETLARDSKEENPWCLTCHATGFGKGGFVDEETTPQLAGVTCESCHPGGHCPDNPPPKGALSDCRVCHTPDQSPGFQEGPYWEKIAH